MEYKHYRAENINCVRFDVSEALAERSGLENFDFYLPDYTLLTKSQMNVFEDKILKKETNRLDVIMHGNGPMFNGVKEVLCIFGKNGQPKKIFEIPLDISPDRPKLSFLTLLMEVYAEFPRSNDPVQNYYNFYNGILRDAPILNSCGIKGWREKDGSFKTWKMFATSILLDIHSLERQKRKYN